MPRLAIVVSAVSSIESLEGTLVSVLENRPADCEIIVVLNGPYSDPYDLKDEVRFVAGRAGSLPASINQALAASRAPFVHLLASGCQVSEGWADAALARFGDRQVGSVAPLVWCAKRCDRIFAAGVGYRRHGRRYLVAQGATALDKDALAEVIGPCSFAGFYRKAAWDAVGGLCPQLAPRHADADLALALQHAGFTVAVEPRAGVRATSLADPSDTPLRQATSEERLFWRNFVGTGRAGTLAAHAARVALELAGSFGRPRMFAQLCGRLWGCAAVITAAGHRRALLETAARTARPSIPEHTRIDRSHEAGARAEAGRTRIGSR